ncbi:MAG: alpha/beta hydrolase [Melioribacteraceae bacterium]
MISRNRFILVAAILFLLGYSSNIIPQNQSVLSKDGVEIVYDAVGNGEQTLVFVHGWSCDKSYWNDQVKTFSPKYKVVAIDLAGHGESGSDRKNYTMELFGEDVAAVVNKLKLNKVILIGHSMGGSVIIEAAKRLKGKVIGLVGADTYQSFKDDWTAEQKEGFLKTITEKFVDVTKGFVKSMFPKTADSLLVNRIADDMSSAPPQVALSAMRNLFFYDPIPTLKEIRLPIISINCDMYPIAIEENKKYVDSFNVKMMNGVGHFVMLEDKDKFNQFLQEAINELVM